MRRLALFAFVLAVAGCGGGGGGGELSREEFVTELDRICADFSRIEEDLPEPESLEEIAEQGATVEREFGSAIQEIRDLGEPPQEIRSDVNRYLELADETHRLIADVVDAAEENDAARIQQLTEGGDTVAAEADEIAKRIGAEECALD